MKELIYKEDARRAALHNEGDAVVAAIDEIKPVDAVPVVRCGKCNYAREIIGGVRLDGSTIWCNHIGQYTNNDWFCADGEPKADEKGGTE